LFYFLSILAVAAAQGNATTTAGDSAAAVNASMNKIMAALGEGTSGFVRKYWERCRLKQMHWYVI
jgi:hypothetical protein